MKTITLVILILSLVVIERSYADAVNWSALVEAVIQVESGGDPHAVSPQGCIGLMQINPRGALAEWCNSSCYIVAPTETYSASDLFCPRINRIIGTWYLRRLHDHYDCKPIELILAAYNGGITRLRRNGWDISKMPAETRSYVIKVMKEYNERSK